MNKTIKLAGATLVLCSGIYFTGVYATGLVTDYYLKDINSYVGQMLPAQTVNLKNQLNVQYIKKDYSFFNENGEILLNFGSYKTSFPVTLKYGFLNADININTDVLNNVLFNASKNFNGLHFKEDSVISNLNGSVSAFTGLNVNASVDASYKENKKKNKKFHLDSSLSVSVFEKTVSTVNLNDFDSYDYAIDSFKSETSQVGIKKLKEFEYSNIDVKGFRFLDLLFDSFYINSKAVNSNDKSFDLLVDIKLSSIDQIIKDFSTQLLVKNFTYENINNYLAQKYGDEITPLDTVKRVDINNLKATLLKGIYHSFGVFRNKPITVDGSGFIDFNENHTLDISKAKLLLKSKDGKDAFPLFWPKADSYECLIEFKDNNLTLNGHRL